MNKKSIKIILIELFILILAIIGVNSNLMQYTPSCLFYEATNLQCPSCGGTRCVGACGLAPVFTINNEVYGKATVKKLDEVLDEYMKKED